MPELPEVETTVRGLKNRVVGKSFLDVWTDAPKLVKRPKGFEEFKKQVQGKRVEDIRRAGKNIIFDLSSDLSLLIHQKLTGHLLYGKWALEKGAWQSQIKGPLRDDPGNKFLHLIFFLDNGYQLALSDVRKFAKIELWRTPELLNSTGLKSLGPDALSDQLTLQSFKALLKKKKGKIKQVLMDQGLVAGIGNIYSDEILFAARVNPFKTTAALKEEELKKIYLAMRKILRTALRMGGTSISDYRTPTGGKGGFSKLRKVYQREGEECARCGAKIARLKIGGRSTHYCPGCQK